VEPTTTTASPAGATVRITLTELPPSATLLLDGTTRVANPLVLPRGSTKRRVEVSAGGYATERLEVTPSGDQALVVHLTPLTPPPRSRPHPSGAGPRKPARSTRPSLIGGSDL
jgi:hypothetical protein